MSNSNLYDKIVLKSNLRTQDTPKTKIYKGFSTISASSSSFALYDIELIKQDILNHFNIRKGERLEQPDFGTLIWDIIFEPLTEDVKRIVVQNVEEIVNYDPRVRAQEVIVTQYESGIQVECALTYLPYYITEQIQLRFDQQNGLMV